MAEVLINSLDAGNPLYLQNNDHSNLPIVGFKLVGSENYNMWSTAIKIALKGKNKIGFIDGTCVKPVTMWWFLPTIGNILKQGELFVPEYYYSLNYLLREFDILSLLPACTCVAHEGVLKHNQLVRLMQFLMGLNDVYQPTRSNLLARDPLPDVNEAFVVVSREETHRGLALGKMSAINPTAFVARTNNGNNNFNNNRRANTNNNSNRGPNPNLVCKHCGLIGHTIERCYELNGYHVGFKKNPNLSKQSGFVKKFSGNNVYVSQNASTFLVGAILQIFTNEIYDEAIVLQLSVGHPNGTMAKITAIASLRLTENVVLFDVLMIPEYTVNLLSVNKMIKDSKYFMGFDESKCYIQDLKFGKIVGTGSESGGLYMFDCDNNVLVTPADQANRQGKPYPLSDHKTIKMGDLVHLDIWGFYKVISRDVYNLCSLLSGIMAEVLINSLDAGNPLYLQNNDHYNLPIVGFKLVGSENYNMWSTAIKIALKGKNKIGFIDGTCVKPVTSVVLAQQLERCNAIFLGSLSQELYLGHVYSEIASEVWDELEETYYKMDGSVIFNIVQKNNNLNQGELYVLEYYPSLNLLWREFDILSLSNMLARDPLPDVHEAFIVVSIEETHRGLDHGKMYAKNPIAFVARTNNGNNNFNNNRRANTNNNCNRGPNPNLVCKQCGLIGHTIERCYELNGYTACFKKNPNLFKQSGYVKKFSGNDVDVSQNASTSSGAMFANFTNEYMMKLLCLINEKHAANVSSSMAGNMPCFFNNNTYFNLHIDKFFCAKSNAYVYNVSLGWIIDYGINQHMILSTKNMFNVIYISSLQLSVGHPNGTMAKITAIASLRLTENVVLFDVLMIPEYTVNLLSVNKMIKDSKYFMGFDESKCYIQDLKFGKIVGTGSESGGLYMFDCNNNGKSFAGLCNSGIVCYVSKELWHCMLGHLADQVLSVLSDKIRSKSGDHVIACDILSQGKTDKGTLSLE
ncbi:ribonuclease H-like domain-containing protein [Tanacetum coccineum]